MTEMTEAAIGSLITANILSSSNGGTTAAKTRQVLQALNDSKLHNTDLATADVLDSPDVDNDYLTAIDASGPTIVRLPLANWKVTKSLKELGATSSMDATAIGALNSAISAAFAAGFRRFDGLDKVYTLTGNTGLIFPTGCEHFGFEYQAGGLSSNTQILYSGGTLGSTKALTANCLIGEYIVTIADTSSFTEGDLVYIDSTAIFFNTGTIGELNRVRRVVDATHLWLDDPVMFNFNTSDTAKILKITASRHETVFRDGRITGGNGVATSQYGLLLQYADHSAIENLETHDIGYVHVGLMRSYAPIARRVRMRRAEDTGLAYGFSLSNGCRGGRINNSDSAWMRHGVTLGVGGNGGVNLDTEVDHFEAHHCRDAGIDGHPAYIGYKVSNVTCRGDKGAYGVGNNDGMIFQGIDTVVDKPTVVGFTGGGIIFQPLIITGPYKNGGRAEVSSFDIRDVAGCAIDFQLSASGGRLASAIAHDGRISGCASGAATSAIRAYVAAGTTLDNVSVSDAHIDTSSGSSGADVLLQVNSTGLLKRATVQNNHSASSGGIGIWADINGGTIESLTIRGGSVLSAASTNGAIYVHAQTNVTAGLLNRLLIDGVDMRSCGYGAQVRANGAGATIISAQFANNYSRSITNANFYVYTSSSGVVTTAQLSGNDSDGGTHGLRANSVTTVITDGSNTFTGASTANRSVTGATNLQLGKDYGATLSITATIASGVATAVPTHTGPIHMKVDTEGASASDDLDTLTLTGVRDQQIVILSANSSSRDIVVKDGTGNFKLAGDFTLNNHEDTISLVYHAADNFWRETGRSDNGA